MRVHIFHNKTLNDVLDGVSPIDNFCHTFKLSPRARLVEESCIVELSASAMHFILNVKKTLFYYCQRF